MSAQSPERPERRRNPRGEGVRLRVEILDAVDGLLAEGEPVTLRSVARRAGIAAPSIYRHFADIDAIMAALAELAFEELVADLAHRRDRESTAIERLRAICDAYLTFAQEKPQRYRLMFGGVWNAAIALDTHPGDDERFRRLGMNAFAVIENGIQDCVAAGVSDSSDTAKDAAALWVSLHGLAHLRQTAPLFEWPPGLDTLLVTELARLRPRPASPQS